MLMASLALVSSGCKKKSPPPPPPQVTPLPKKPEAQPATGAAVIQPNVPASKPVLAKPSSAKLPIAKSPAQIPVQSQITTSKRLTPLASINLEFANRRDPFKPYAQMPAQQQQNTKTSSSKGRVADPLPIQKFDTERFKISGIITGMKENSALIVDPNGKGFVVKEGMLVGNNDGVVKRITSNSVEVEETFRDDKGKLRKRTVKLTLLRKK